MRTEQIGRAPGDLAVVQSFINTLDIEQSIDELPDPAALRAWLDQAGLCADSDGRSRAVTAADLAAAIKLREALRKVLRSHVTHVRARAQADPAPDVAAELREISARLPTRLEVGDDGKIWPAAAGSGIDAALARILLIAAEAATLDSWDRLKVCSADDCQWAFYDRSPTRNGCWCSMQICGSRAKSRAYRSRVAAAKS
ncbi:MAG: CGNR zinc finger domain-containing protein [Streptosporangiaceae bacterium]